MNSLTYQLPWTTPGPLGLVMSTGFVPLSFLLAILLLVIDWCIYYPFFRVYDNQILEQELHPELATEEENEGPSLNELMDQQAASEEKDEETNVLVLCAGGGTSRQLANSLNRGAKEYGIKLSAAGAQYGAHDDMLPNFDLVVLAPQVATNYADLKKDTDKLGIGLEKTDGEQYISLIQDPEGALKFVFQALNKDTDIKKPEDK